MKPPFPRQPSGVALVIVLSFLVLVTGLVIAFISSVNTDAATSKQSDSSARVKQLADATVNLVMGQIKEATTTGGIANTWASQPGMIRSYSSTTVSGGFPAKPYDRAYYKLYSSADMTVEASEIATFSLAAEVPTDWFSQTAQYVDLNAPALDSSGVSQFPIFDPSASGVIAGSNIAGAPVASGANANAAPMPARWIYVLKDGTLTTPASGTTVAVWPSSGANSHKSPSRENPIVGRIAFWTDDETCKVNINTAGEGAYWDTPRADTNQERDLADKQPVKSEFQRYPGHPATTSLSTIFPALTAANVYTIAPRLQEGGSKGGTATTTVATPAVTLDTERLYASVDELIFNASRSTATGLSKDQLEKSKFFLTASSRAPEINLLNKPRLACWPVFKGLAAAKTTIFDRMIAFCSTINSRPYYFQRENADSPSNDIAIARNADLYSYLQNLTSTPVPGFGGHFSQKYTNDRDQILTEVFDYIRSTNLADDNLTAVNRFTNNFGAAGYGMVAPTVKNGTMGFGRTPTLSALSIGLICNAAADDPATTGTDESAGSNVPGTNKVLGSTALAAKEKYIQAIILPQYFSTMQGMVELVPEMRVAISGLDTLSVTDSSGATQSLFPAAANTSSFYNANPGFGFAVGRNWGGAFHWQYTFGQADSAEPSKGSPARGNIPADGGNTYPFIGTPIKIRDTGGSLTFNGGDITVQFYSTLTLAPANLLQTIKLHLPQATFPTPRIVDTGTPATGNFSTPATGKEYWWSFAKGGVVTGKEGRLKYANSRSPEDDKAGALFRKDYDVVRMILPRHGDFRLVAATANLDDQATPNALFVKHPNYDDQTKRMAQTFGGYATKDFLARDNGGKYIASLAYSSGSGLTMLGSPPVIPSNALPAERPEATGDFDNGTALAEDGPYTNKPDEGNTLRVTATSIPYFANNNTSQAAGQTIFTPNRIMPSPGMFGSLPTGVIAKKPWKTLLFRPQGLDFPTTGASGLLRHPSYSTSCPDHLLLDLFWMPVVEPYAISDPFATAGKINMNYQIAPFTYIERSTGLRAILKSEKVGSIPNTLAISYKSVSSPAPNLLRLEVNMDETLGQFRQKFDPTPASLSGDIFKSASEICDLHIVPIDPNDTKDAAATMAEYWNKHQLTGDNIRERIYTTLYPRLTTKSNTYTIHYRVQVLKQPTSLPAAQWATWDEGRGLILSESRGSTTIERYIDPNQATLPDFATDTAATVDPYYRFRIVSTKKFAP